MIRKMISLVAASLLILAVSGASAFADGWTFASEDDADTAAAAAFRIKYNGSETATVQFIGTTNIQFINGTKTDNISLETTQAVDYVVIQANAITNSSGQAQFTVQPWASLTTDDVGSNLIAVAATTLKKNRWYYLGTWDTSLVKRYGVVASFCASKANADLGNPAILQKIAGNIGGTGDVTLRVYKGTSDKIWEKLITSPVYVRGLYETTVQTNGVVNTVTLDEDVMLPIGHSGVKYYIRAARATTGTTGGLGILAE